MRPEDKAAQTDGKKGVSSTTTPTRHCDLAETPQTSAASGSEENDRQGFHDEEYND